MGGYAQRNVRMYTQVKQRMNYDDDDDDVDYFACTLVLKAFNICCHNH